ncbi:MAG: alpha/beta hydrolase [Bacteroidales bacterium]
MRYTIKEIILKHEPQSKNTPTERKKMGLLYYIETPSITIYNPINNNGKAIMLTPGGGYSFSAIDIEGHKYAEWLASLGYIIGVLKYRMPEGDRKRSYLDWINGFNTFVQECSNNQIEKRKIGHMAFSAGSHLSLTAINNMCAQQTPQFAIHFYPLISLEEPLAHRGSVDKLLGKEASKELRREHSPIINLKHSPANTLIIYSEDDTTVNTENSELLHSKLNSLDLRCDVIHYKTGGHGWGFNDKFEYHEDMKQQVMMFLDRL